MKLNSATLFSLVTLLIYPICVRGIFAHEPCNEDESFLLLQMKKRLSFSSFSDPSYPPRVTTSRLVSWESSRDCCSWKGIKCNTTTGRVIWLDLSDESIASGIDNSSTLFKLQYLTGLNLAFNMFHSPIPSGFGKLTNLNYLNLSCSRFEGQVPVEISQLKRLVSLDLSMNHDLELKNPSFEILVKDLFDLRELILDTVNISMHGIEWSDIVSSTLPNLRVLSLINCGLSGPPGPSLLKLQSLSEFRLDYNPISAQIPEFLGKFPNLVTLSLTGCELLGNIQEEIFHLPLLRSLDLSENIGLHGSLPDFPKNVGLEKLVFSYSSFTGNIPESLSYLTGLRYIDFSKNNFMGGVPYLGSLVNLTYLNLGSNLLNGTIPFSPFNLPSLQTLDLSQNRFTGQLSEFQNVTSLTQLDLSNNMLEGSIPSSLFKVRTLKFLALSYNNFNGTLEFDRFQNLENLYHLDLSGNYWINTSGADTWLIPQFEVLRLGSCHLKTFPQFISNQTNLLNLDLSNNQIRGKIPNWIERLGTGRLYHLNLSMNMLENPDQPLPKGLFNSLTALDLHSNLLRGPIPILPPRAGFLDFSHNKMTSIFPIDDVVSYLNGSVYFSVSNNSLAGRIPPSICYAIYIVFLDLSNNRFNGLIPQCLGSLTRLTTLDLSGNSIEGEVPKALANCTNLEVLDLGNNKLTGSFPCWLGELPELRILILASNKLDGPINYTGLNTFSKLHVIDLSSNSFTGDLPSELFMTWKALMTADNAQADYQQQRFGFEFAQRGFVFYQDFVTLTVKGLRMEHAKILTVFTSVDLSNNLFDGEVPEVIGKLIALHALNLSHNALTGSIPSSLGNLKQLESLDLSKNKLHGAIPTELSDLMFLQVLNLSFNSLAGRIPTGRQLQTFTEDFFQGNNLLCGPPMSKMCAEDDVPSTTDDNHSCNSLLKDCQKGGKFNWQLTSVTLGYGAGIGIAFCMATFWRPWNQLCSTISKRILN